MDEKEKTPSEWQDEILQIEKSIAHAHASIKSLQRNLTFARLNLMRSLGKQRLQQQLKGDTDPWQGKLKQPKP